MAINVISEYRKLQQTVQQLRKQADTANAALAAMREDVARATGNLLPEHEEKLRKIGEELDRLNIYMDGAKLYAAIPNHVPQAQDVHPAKLQQLYTMLSADDDGRAAARELMILCANAKKFFEQQIDALEKALAQQKKKIADDTAGSPQAVQLKKLLAEIPTQYATLAAGPDAQALAAELWKRINAFYVKAGAAYPVQLPDHDPEKLCIGTVIAPHPLSSAYSPQLTKTFGSLYNSREGTLRLPLQIDGGSSLTGDEYGAMNIRITYDDTTIDKIQTVLRGLTFNILRNYSFMQHRITYIDLDTFNPDQLDFLQSLAGEHGIIDFAASAPDAKRLLEGLLDTVKNEQKQDRPRRYLILRGIRTGGSELTQLLRNLCMDCRQYNISTFFVDRQGGAEQASGLLAQLNIGLTLYTENGGFVTDKLGDPLRFGFFAAPGGIESSSMGALQAACTPKKVNNRYEASYPLHQTPGYITRPRARERISLPYGVNEKNGQLISVTLEDMEFASFLMGGSGSGKTTTIHALIAGVIRNYHPDEVELWLADFKEAGFAPYTKYLPPHIKYILMDSSDEMVCDFIDKMHAELMRRKKLFNERLDVPVSRYMPAIFVIIDEFAKMSQVVNSKEAYMMKLEELMTQGRSMGFRFIFSSQGFTNGAGALKSLAKDQIQARMAMAHSNEDEIKGLLDISRLSDALPPTVQALEKHHVLYKQPVAGGKFEMRYALGLYFDGEGEAAWQSRYRLFAWLRENMTAVEESAYDPGKPGQYVNKHPVICGSDALEVFDPEAFGREVRHYRDQSDSILIDTDLVMSLGKPRALDTDVYTFLSAASRENIFLLTNRNEITCTMSVLLTAARSVLNQGGKVQVWADRTSHVFRKYKKSHFAKLELAEGKEQICAAMEKMARQLGMGVPENTLIILLGMDRIYQELLDDNTGSPFASYAQEGTYRPAPARYAMARTADLKPFSTLPDPAPAEADEEDKLALSDSSVQSFLDMISMVEKVSQEGAAAGKSRKQVDEEMKRKANEMFKEDLGEDAVLFDMDEETDEDTDALPDLGQALRLAGGAEQAAAQPGGQQTNKPNYARLFKDLLEHGSRQGRHFLLCVNDYNQLRDLDISIKTFNHRLAFRTDSKDTASLIFNTNQAGTLRDNICLYAGFGAASGSFMVTPYLHQGVTWDAWEIDESGKAINRASF